MKIGLNDMDTTARNAIEDNSIFGNGTLGIGLGNDGVTLNNSSGHTGPNLYQDFPVLSSVAATSTGTTIAGTVQGPTTSILRVEFFLNPTADPSGYGQDKTYRGFVDVMTSSSGSASFSFSTSTVVAAGQYVAATATDANSNPSEFSAQATLPTAPVNVTKDLSIKSWGFVYNRVTRQFTQTMTITNTRGAAITGPIELVFLNLKNATVVNSTGATQGNSYMTVLSTGSLAVDVRNELEPETGKSHKSEPSATEEPKAMIEQRFPPGCDQDRVQRLLAKLDRRTEEEWVAADEARQLRTTTRPWSLSRSACFPRSGGGRPHTSLNRLRSGADRVARLTFTELDHRRAVPHITPSVRTLARAPTDYGETPG